MNKKVLTYIMLLMVAWQSLTAMVDLHPHGDSESNHVSLLFVDKYADFGEHSPDSSQRQSVTADDLFHCHHNGCHFYMANQLDWYISELIESLQLDAALLHPESLVYIPYRPPIA